MSKELVSDELWEIVEPLLPEEPPNLKAAALAWTTTPPGMLFGSFMMS